MQVKVEFPAEALADPPATAKLEPGLLTQLGGRPAPQGLASRCDRIHVRF